MNNSIYGEIYNSDRVSGDNARMNYELAKVITIEADDWLDMQAKLKELDAECERLRSALDFFYDWNTLGTYKFRAKYPDVDDRLNDISAENIDDAVEDVLTEVYQQALSAGPTEGEGEAQTAIQLAQAENENADTIGATNAEPTPTCRICGGHAQCDCFCYDDEDE